MGHRQWKYSCEMVMGGIRYKKLQNLPHKARIEARELEGSGMEKGRVASIMGHRKCKLSETPSPLI